MSNDTVDRIHAVVDELRAIRADLAPPGKTPHAELHDVVKAAEKHFTGDDSLPTYFAQLRDS